MRKKPAEVFNIMAEFEVNMDASETLDAYTVSCLDRDGEAHAEMITGDEIADRTRISMKILGGEVSLSPYELSIITTTSLGQIFQIDEDVTVY